MRRFTGVVAAIVVTTTMAVGPAHASITDVTKVRERLTAILSKTNGSAVAVAVKNRDIIAEAGRGATAQTLLHLASISKTVTAVAVLRLAQRGKVDLDQPIEQYLPDLFGPGGVGNPEIGQQPVAAFMNHATGLRSQNMRAVGSGLTGWSQYATQAARSSLTSRPGAYVYANDNFVLLTKLVEEVADRPFNVAVQQLVWDPLGVPGGYLDVASRGTQVLGGAGAWVTSAYNVAILFDALNPGTTGKKLLSPAWLAYMHGRLYADEYRNGLRYRNGHWGHTGSLARVRSAAVVDDDGTVYVVLSEGARPESSDRLFDALARLG